VRALPRAGDEAEADAVVLPDHRLRPASAGRTWWRWRAVARPCPGHAAQLDRAFRGAYVDFTIEGRAEPIRVFTTRPDTLFGATFMVVAPDAPLAAENRSDGQRTDFEAYLEKTKQATRSSGNRPTGRKTGVSLGVSATNPVNGDWCRSGRPTTCSASMDRRDHGRPRSRPADLDFARTYGLPVRMVIDTGEPDPSETGTATAGDGAY